MTDGRHPRRHRRHRRRVPARRCRGRGWPDRRDRARPVGARGQRRRGDRRDRAARPARCRRRPHAHAGRERRRTGPVLPGFGRGGVRRHDLVPVVQQPGDGIVSPAAERSLVTGRPRVARRDRRRQRHRLRPEPRDQRPLPTIRWRSCRRRSMPGVATSKAFMVFDFRLPDERLFEAMRVMARHGGMLQVHCEDPVLLDAAVADALQRGDMAPRYHATTRPPLRRGGRDGPGARVRPPGRCARPRRPPVVGGGARRGPSRQGGRRPRERGDLSPLPGLHRGGLRRARPVSCAPATSSRRRSAPPPTATRCGPAWPTARSIWSRPTTSRIGSPSRRATPRAACRSTRSATARRASRRCSRSSTAKASRAGGSRSSGWSTCSPRRPPAGSASPRRAPSRSVATPTSSCSTPPPAGRSAPTDLHHTSDYTPYEGIEVAGAVRDVLVRGRGVIRAGAFVGRRGNGAYLERGQPAG